MANKKDGDSKNKKTAMEVASDYLAYRMRTIAEVRKRLQEKEFDAEDINKTIAELIELHYLDDYDFAMHYYEYNADKKRGSLRAKRELAEKSVDKEIIKNAFEDFEYKTKLDEYKMAKEIVEKEKEDVAIDEKFIAKMGRKLDSKGFKKDDIFKVLDDLRNGK